MYVRSSLDLAWAGSISGSSWFRRYVLVWIRKLKSAGKAKNGHACEIFC